MHENSDSWVFDWNQLDDVDWLENKPFELLDETLRDGLQSPSVTDPPLPTKKALLHTMESLGIAAVDLGLPGAGPRARRDVLGLAQEIADNRLQLQPVCAARTAIADIQPIADIVQATGMPISVYAFVGSSPIRMAAEGWTREHLLELIGTTVRFCNAQGLEICLVTEDTVRSRPDVLDPLFRHAIALGVRRLCLCDTVGHASPEGVRNLVSWTQSLVRGTGASVKLDWHGHNDRGLAVINSIVALQAGVDRVHGTALGIGERVGNASLDQILVNLKLFNAWPHDLTPLMTYCERVSKVCDVPIPVNHPVVGRDAFRTATGVHAAAVLRAQKQGYASMADRVYSSVPAAMVGRAQEIAISHQSGTCNVLHWLKRRQLPANADVVRRILDGAKAADHLLSEEELMALARRDARTSTLG